MNIPIYNIENYTDAHRLNVRGVPVLKRGNYFVDDSVSVNGDAPKKFVEFTTINYSVINTKPIGIIGFGILQRQDTNGIPLSP